MKNLIKVLGIIAMFAVIGLGSCEVDEEEQTSITVTGIPAAFNGKYAYVGVSDAIDGSNIRELSLPKQIANGTVSQLLLLSAKDKKAATAKNGYIKLNIDSQEDLNGATLYSGVTRGVKTLGEGNKSVDATEDFFPSIGDAAKKYIDDNTPKGPDYTKEETFFGKYTTTYTTNTEGTITETIEFNETSFKLSDVSTMAGKGGDSLTFNITSWDKTVTTPQENAGAYPYAFKFTGKITQATSGYIPASEQSKTAPGFGTADINVEGVYMYLYFTGTGTSFTFVRSPFSNTAHPNGNAPVTGADNALRVYTRQQ